MVSPSIIGPVVKFNHEALLVGGGPKPENEMRKVVFVALLTIAGASQASAQDAAAGEKVFGVCKTCHQIGENAKTSSGRF